jgi:hypothetical protein
MHLIMVEKNARQHRGALDRIFVWESSAKMELQTVWTRQEEEDAMKEKLRAEWIAEEEALKKSKEKEEEEQETEEESSSGS